VGFTTPDDHYYPSTFHNLSACINEEGKGHLARRLPGIIMLSGDQVVTVDVTTIFITHSISFSVCLSSTPCLG